MAVNPFLARANMSASPSMISEDHKKLLIKGVLTGTVLAVAGSMMYRNGMVPVPIVGDVPAVIPLFISGAASSMIADGTKEGLHKVLPAQVQQIGDIGTTLVGAAICGGATAGINSVAFQMPAQSLLPSFGLGSGSYFASDYTEKLIFDTYYTI